MKGAEPAENGLQGFFDWFFEVALDPLRDEGVGGGDFEAVFIQGQTRGVFEPNLVLLGTYILSDMLLDRNCFIREYGLHDSSPFRSYS